MLKIAVVSSESIFGGVDANLGHFKELIEQAAEKGARLIGWPELALNSHSTHQEVLRS